MLFKVFTIACYISASVCFFIAISGPKVVPRKLDILALGLFLFTLPIVIEKVQEF